MSYPQLRLPKILNFCSLKLVTIECWQFFEGNYKFTERSHILGYNEIILLYTIPKKLKLLYIDQLNTYINWKVKKTKLKIDRLNWTFPYILRSCILLNSCLLVSKILCMLLNFIHDATIKPFILNACKYNKIFLKPYDTNVKSTYLYIIVII